MPFLEHMNIEEDAFLLKHLVMNLNSGLIPTTSLIYLLGAHGILGPMVEGEMLILKADWIEWFVMMLGWIVGAVSLVAL